MEATDSTVVQSFDHMARRKDAFRQWLAQNPHFKSQSGTFSILPLVSEGVAVEAAFRTLTRVQASLHSGQYQLAGEALRELACELQSARICREIPAP